MLRLYQSRGVNPWGGCLPMLVQLPIFIALYQVFRFYLLKDPSVLAYSFIPHPPTLNPVAFGFIDLTKVDYYVLPYLVGATQFLLSWWMNKFSARTKPKPKDEKQKAIAEQMELMSRSMTYFMPLMLVFISLTLPAVIALYFLASNIFSLFQYYFFFRAEPKVKIKEKDVGGKD